ncbi:nucleoside-diphosphate sugar epimerase/dehydratase [Sulfurimonas diazotrophicus]|uniref:Nucleoside-diphosphate sugar epimerase/dehydratase n=1 Tax=Sulfurimonas diazotrophicus TaxID=3131939 RepID=A0ABZ3HB97_9BACT
MSGLLRPTSGKRILFFLLLDMLLSLATLYGAYALRFNFDIPLRFFSSFDTVYLYLVGFKVVAFFFFRIYFIVWRFVGFAEAKNIVKAHVAAYTVFTGFYLLFPALFDPFPRSVIIIDFFLSIFAIGALRVAKRLMTEQERSSHQQPVLLLGVNPKTASIIKSAQEGDIPYYPSAVVVLSAENRSAVGTYISNIRVYGEEAVESLIRERGIAAAIVTSTLAQDELQALYARLSDAGVNEVKRVRLLGGQYDKLEDLSIEDLLARHPKDLDKEVIAGFVKGKRVLITGAGGSIGSEIARQCRRFGASALALIDHSEFNLYTVGEAIPEASLEMFSVTDGRILEEKMAAFGADIVIHAAAYKHVPLCEANKTAAVRNNVLGTKNVIDASIAAGVGKVVIVSTDKAVRPTNVMGATKRVTELYAGNVQSGATEIVAVRFGNVLGSSGSVIPKFKRQIEAGGPVTVTDPEMTRYFMLIPEACQLVLQAAAIAKGGELFILDMGEPVKIIDLARQMIRLYGKEDEIKIEVCGLRPGEKLYEELLIDDTEEKTRYSSIFIAGKTDYPIDKLEEDIEKLLETKDKVAALKQIVPEFDHKP